MVRAGKEVEVVVPDDDADGDKNGEEPDWWSSDDRALASAATSGPYCAAIWLRGVSNAHCIQGWSYLTYSSMMTAILPKSRRYLLGVRPFPKR